MRIRKLTARITGGALGLLLASSLVLVPAPVLAAPGLPHQFYGTVTIGTELAPVGTIVSAQIGEIEYLSTTVDAEGRYGYDPLFKVPADDRDTPEKEGGVAGDMVEFYVSNTLAAQYEFEIWGVTELDLAPEVLEYGDAPDPTYPSLFASDGARHLQSPGAFLGLLSDGDNLDWELDANVPDLDLLDDGLVTTTITADNPAQTVTFEVTDLTAPSYDLRVNILIDLNADGDWTDAGEHVVVNQLITTTATGTVGEVFDSTPFSTVGATPGSTWLRITLTRHEIQDPPWDGTMADAGLWGWDRFECGETEDWAITIEPVGALSAAKGTNTPSDHGWYWDPEADPYNEMLQMGLTADPAEDMIINSVTVEASGTGNDATGIAAVDLVADSNSNGLVDDAELPAIATGTYPLDDGVLILTIEGGYTVTQGTTEYFIIDYQMDSSPLVGETFIATVTDVSAVGASSGLSIVVSGLPIVSATKTTIITEYTLTMAVEGEGTVTPESGDYPEGDMTITATPASGWEFASWSTEDMAEIADASSAETTLTLDKDKTVTATFTQITYDLTMAVVGEGTATDVTGLSPYEEGASVSIKAEAAALYQFVNWTAPAGTFLDADAEETTFTMPGAAVTVTANFELIPPPTYDLTMAVVGEGTATDVTNASPYEEGVEVSIKAEAAALYQFVNWTATAGIILDATQAETTFTMPGEAATVTANFELIPPPTYDLTMAVVGEGTATDVTGLSPYEEGASVSIKAEAAALYQFVNWTAPAGTFLDADAEETTFTMPGEAATVTANFAVTITHELTMLVVGEGTVTPDSGTYPEGDMTITATIPASGWEFAGWTTTDMAEIADPTSAETTLTLDKDKTVTATFTEVVTYDLMVASTAGGTVTDPSEDAFTYNAGTVVNLVAVPEEGYAFGWWSGDVGTIADVNAASTTVTMDSAKSIVANFVEFSAPENVSVTEIDPGVESVTVTDEPAEELDVTGMPAGITPQEAYVVEPTGTGSFTLVFTDVSNASDIRVYKVVDGTWTLLDVTVVDATTVKVTMDVADPILVFALPPATIATTTLPAGWNLLSTPVKLDADSDSLEQILGESLANIESSYRWDVISQQWEVPTSYELSPLEAVYLKVKSDASAIAEFIPSGEISELPSRDLVVGLNLIGLAPALEDGVFPDMPLDQALISVKEAGALTGYTMVVSPAHNQPGWAYALGGEIRDLLPYKGYWVVMENASTLYGSSTTPIE